MEVPPLLHAQSLIGLFDLELFFQGYTFDFLPASADFYARGFDAQAEGGSVLLQEGFSLSTDDCADDEASEAPGSISLFLLDEFEVFFPEDE